MTVEILLAPVGAGKTEVALQRLAAVTRDQPFARVWILVSGKRQEDAFRERLADLLGGANVYFNIEFFSFYQLYHRVLNIAGQPQRRLDDTARFGLLRAIIEDLLREDALRVYAPIATTPGFLRIVADFIYELKQNIVLDTAFAAAAEKRSQKDRELALIYSAYQRRLILHNLVDREGEGWLALDMAEKRSEIGRDVALLLIDGYDQFSRLQAKLLMLLAERAQHALITLTTVPGREAVLGRRFEQAFAQLQRAAVAPIVETRLAAMPPGVVDRRHPALRHLTDVLSRPAAARSAGGSVVFIEAPDAAAEAAAVLRRAKRLLLENGAQPDDILIALRDWARYAGCFAALGRAYDLPLSLHRGEPISQNPAVLALMTLLGLHEHDFRRRDLLDVLRSPYFLIDGLDGAAVNHLERIAEAFLLTGGRKLWLEAVEASSSLTVQGDGDEEISAQFVLPPDEAAPLQQALAAFFDAITPPEIAPLEVYLHWLDVLIGPDADSSPDAGDDPQSSTGYTLHMPQQVKQQSAPGVVERDLAALQELKRVLHSLHSARTLLKSLGEEAVLEREAFILELRTAVNHTGVRGAPGRTGRILVTTVTDGRGLPHKHVFIPGLSEGIFPALLPPDPLYIDSERSALREAGIDVQLRAERAADDGLFYELISQAQDSLTLSRPTVQNGVPWVASHLWRSAAAAFDDAAEIMAAQRIRLGAVVPAQGSASLPEAILAVARGMTAASPDKETVEVYNWLVRSEGAVWPHIRRARQIEAGRMSRRRTYDRYSGRLSRADLIGFAADQLGPQRRWSASQLNDYGICGFRFFAKRLLRLEPLKPPEEGLDAAKLGTINHDILEKTYAEVKQRGLAIAPEHASTALAILRQKAEDILRKAPLKLGFRATPMWAIEQRALLRRLEALVALDFSEDSPVAKLSGGVLRHPDRFEIPFGVDDGIEVEIPVEVDGRPELLRVQGYIDRMDRTDNGVVIVDYKTGSTKIPVEEMTIGRNFQMMVYLEAAQQMLAVQNNDDTPQTVLGGMFWHIRSREASGAMLLDDEGLENIEAARAVIGAHVTAGRRGDFASRPRKVEHGRCTHYCEYVQFCRMAITSRSKPES